MLWIWIALFFSHLVGIGHPLPDPKTEINTCNAGYATCEAAGIFDVNADLVHLYANLVTTINDDNAGLPVKQDGLKSSFPRDVVTVICCVLTRTSHIAQLRACSLT